MKVLSLFIKQAEFILVTEANMDWRHFADLIAVLLDSQANLDWTHFAGIWIGGILQTLLQTI